MTNTATEIIEEIITAYGGVAGTQSRFKYKNPMAVYNWRARGIPRALIADIHTDTGISIPRLKQASLIRKSPPS